MTYVTFEGGEGSGKSTQARLLANRLENPVITREPGATPLGVQLRALLLTSEEFDIDDRAETLLMAADRAQHMAEVVRPGLAEGRIVLSDRSVYSSLAYQGAGRQLGVAQVKQLNEWALDGCWPDLVVLLDVQRETAQARLDRALDRLEQASEEFHKRVLESYRQMAADDPDHWVVVSAEGTIDDVSARVWSAVRTRLGWS